MPLYFFITAGLSRADAEGFEFADDYAARQEAELVLRDLARNLLQAERPSLTVEDASGRTVAMLRVE